MNDAKRYYVERVNNYTFNVVNRDTNTIQSSWANKLDANDTCNRLNKLFPMKEVKAYENNVIPLFD